MSGTNAIYSRQISASPEKVWSVILHQYPQWIAAVCGEGARVVGEWGKGSDIEFHAPSNKGGMVGRVTVYEINSHVKWECAAMIKNGEQSICDENSQCHGMFEEYQLASGEGGSTKLTATYSYEGMPWEAALDGIKQLAEAA